MRSVDQERRQQQRNALKPLGISPRETRSWVHEVEIMGREAEILALPVLAGVTQALQDPVTGAPYFMAGIDPVGGTAPIGAP